MLKPQKISERLRNTIRYIRPTKRPVLKAWHFLHGPGIAAVFTYLIAFSSIISSFYYKFEQAKLQATIFFGIIFVSFGEPIMLWAQRRSQVAELSDILTSAAEKLEERSTPMQMRKMNRITVIARIIRFLYIGDVSMCITSYVTFPFRTGTLSAAMPFLLPADMKYYWCMYAVQSYIQIAGSIAFGTMLVYHTETSLCLKCLYDILSQQLDGAASRKDINVSIDIHQRLLNASSKLQHFFSRSWLNLMIIIITVLTINTYIILSGSVEPVFFILIGTVLSVILAPCFLSELVSTSYGYVGKAVYFSDWVSKPGDIRKDLALIILRSQRKFYFKAGIFGSLNMPKFLALLKRWYSLAQALINFG